MASTVYYLVFSGFIFAAAQSFSFENSKEWDVERYSDNPLSYTDEDHYSRDVTTESPVRNSPGKRLVCPANEHYNLCYANCQETCDTHEKPLPCPRACIWGCVCDVGLIRGPDERCIKPSECPTKSQAEAKQNFLTDISDTLSEETENLPNSRNGNPPASKSKTWPIPIPLICGNNEIFDPCPISCPDDCNNFRDKHRKCIRICIPSCICKSGLVRNHDGKCIMSYECPQEKHFCPSGEEYSPCHSHCESNCATREENTNNCQRDSIICVSGCTCKAGLVRGPEGTCMYDSECPTDPPTEPPIKVCPENERYEECKGPCQRNCSNVHSAIPCPRICIPGCVCNEPLIRGKYGKCIEKDECPKDSSLSDSHVTLNPPPYPDDEYHISESVTETLPISETENSEFEEIPPISHSKSSHECPPRQQWVVCGGHCQRNCSNKDDKDFSCRPVCIPGCICEEGLVIGPDGDCIKKEECPSESDSEGDQANCKKDEMYSMCHGNCEKNCSNWAFDLVCPQKCVSGCVCKPGRIRGPNGNCILWSKCPRRPSRYSGKASTESPLPIKSEQNKCHIVDHICPDEEICDCACQTYSTAKRGKCSGPDNKQCICYLNGRAVKFLYEPKHMMSY